MNKSTNSEIASQETTFVLLRANHDEKTHMIFNQQETVYHRHNGTHFVNVEKTETPSISGEIEVELGCDNSYTSRLIRGDDGKLHQELSF